MNDAARTPAPTLRDRALSYASAGIAVFPCVPGGRTPLTANGFHDATTNLDQIAAWWTTRPQAREHPPRQCYPGGRRVKPPACPRSGVKP